MASYISDHFGRKITLAVGSLILLLGAFINAFARGLGMFIAGRVLVGAAGPFGKITAIALLHEIAHPRLRPIIASSYYCNYYFGSIAAAWFCYGSLHWGNTSWAWRAPCLFQIMAPAAVLIWLVIIPESPRWLIRHGKTEKALNILAKSHANGDTEDELVKYEYREICHVIQMEEESKKTRYVDFLKTGGNRRRLIVLMAMATGTNCKLWTIVPETVQSSDIAHRDRQQHHLILPVTCSQARGHHQLHTNLRHKRRSRSLELVPRVRRLTQR